MFSTKFELFPGRCLSVAVFADVKNGKDLAAASLPPSACLLDVDHLPGSRGLSVAANLVLHAQATRRLRAGGSVGEELKFVLSPSRRSGAREQFAPSASSTTVAIAVFDPENEAAVTDLGKVIDGTAVPAQEALDRVLTCPVGDEPAAWLISTYGVGDEELRTRGLEASLVSRIAIRDV